MEHSPYIELTNEEYEHLMAVVSEAVTWKYGDVPVPQVARELGRSPEYVRKVVGRPRFNRESLNELLESLGLVLEQVMSSCGRDDISVEPQWRVSCADGHSARGPNRADLDDFIKEHPVTCRSGMGDPVEIWTALCKRHSWLPDSQTEDEARKRAIDHTADAASGHLR
jgi:hypothetical protein